jgi:hypothetical protein
MYLQQGRARPGPLAVRCLRQRRAYSIGRETLPQDSHIGNLARPRHYECITSEYRLNVFNNLPRGAR